MSEQHPPARTAVQVAAPADVPDIDRPDPPKFPRADAPSTATGDMWGAATGNEPRAARADMSNVDRVDRRRGAPVGVPGIERADPPESAVTDAPSAATGDVPSFACAHVPSVARADVPNVGPADVQSPVRADVQSPVRADVRSPVRADVRSPVRADVRSPVRAEVQSPVRAEVQSPVRAEVQSPVRAEVQNPVRADAQSSARRWVLHIDMDAFFASVEQLTRPTLRGRPVLVGGTGGRGVVAGASYEARVYGARSAMPMHMARRLVGVTAVVVPPRGVVYGVLSGQVFDTLRGRIPVLETLSFDEAFGEPAELAGATVAQVQEFCEDLRAAVRERTGLTASVGAGTGKQLAKIASGLAKPDGIRVVSAVEQPQMLAALPVRKLWGIGPVAEHKLRSLGIETVGAFAALPESEAMSILGTSVGAALHRLARGIDDRPVAERNEAKQISAETTYETDIVTLAQLRPAIEKMAAAAHRRLVKDGRAARTVVLKLRKSDMSIVTRSFTLPYATEDLVTLTTAAQRSAIDPAELGSIRLVGVGYGGLSTVRQESLFPELDQAPIAEEWESTAEAEPDAPPVPAPATPLSIPLWHPGMDVEHPEHGHGWVQGGGYGVVTVRFETRSTGPGPARTFPADDPSLTRADPLNSLR